MTCLRLCIEIAVAVYHLLSLVVILPTFCEIIKIYCNRITECKFLRDEFSKVPINWKNQAIMELSELNYLSSMLQKGTVRDRAMANTFSSFYILTIIVYSASYAFYLSITKRLKDMKHWSALGFLLSSALILILFMLYTNQSGKKLKKQTARIYCLNDCEDENSAAPINNAKVSSIEGPLVNLRRWNSIVPQFDSYALFFIFSSIPAQLTIYVTGSMVPWAVLSIMKAHDYPFHH